MKERTSKSSKSSVRGGSRGSTKGPRDSLVRPGLDTARKFKGGLVDQYPAVRYLPSGLNLEIAAISRSVRLPLGPDGTKYGPA